MLVILRRPEPPSLRERTQEDFLVFHYSPLPSMLIFTAWAESAIAPCGVAEGGQGRQEFSPGGSHLTRRFGPCGTECEILLSLLGAVDAVEHRQSEWRVASLEWKEKPGSGHPEAGGCVGEGWV